MDMRPTFQFDWNINEVLDILQQQQPKNKPFTFHISLMLIFARITTTITELCYVVTFLGLLHSSLCLILLLPLLCKIRLLIYAMLEFFLRLLPLHQNPSTKYDFEILKVSEPRKRSWDNTKHKDITFLFTATQEWYKAKVRKYEDFNHLFFNQILIR